MTGVRAVVDREELAREVLAEFTRPGDVGALLDEVGDGDGVVTLHFVANMPGYPGWRWTVSLAQLDGEEPTVLESELTPGDGALLAPEWVPWSERLEEYRAQQAAEAAARGEAADAGESDADDSDDDDSDDDDSDDDDPDDDGDDLGDDVYDGLDPEAAVGLDESDAPEDDGSDGPDEDRD